MDDSIFWKGCRPLHTAGWIHEDQRPKRWALRTLLSPLSKTRLSLMSHIYKGLGKSKSMLQGTHVHISYLRLPQQPYRETGKTLWSPLPLVCYSCMVLRTLNLNLFTLVIYAYVWLIYTEQMPEQAPHRVWSSSNHHTLPFHLLLYNG